METAEAETTAEIQEEAPETVIQAEIPVTETQETVIQAEIPEVEKPAKVRPGGNTGGTGGNTAPESLE